MAQVQIQEHGEPQIFGVMKHCRSCFREDIHFKVGIPPFVFGFLLVATFGLVFFMHPTRCVTCGKVRFF
jgi:hypothetical protein